MKHILKLFGEASWLITNLDKTEFYPIRCTNINIEDVLGIDQRISTFPCMYLVLPLHFKKLPKNMVLTMIQKIASWFLGWKRNLLSYPG
jgi:hypothetical protein